MAAERKKKYESIQRGEVAKVLSKQRLNLLLALFLALCAIFLWLLRVTPEGQRWLALWEARRNAWLSRQRIQEALKNDPSWGFPLERVGIPNLPEDKSPILLVVLGRCEGCNERVVFDWAEMGKWETLRKVVRFALVLQEGAVKVEEVGKRAKRVSLIADEREEIARRLNAFFVPRAYGFDGGRLVWIQKEPNLDKILDKISVLKEFLDTVVGREKEQSIIDAWSREMREKAWGKSLISSIEEGEKP